MEKLEERMLRKMEQKDRTMCAMAKKKKKAWNIWEPRVFGLAEGQG